MSQFQDVNIRFSRAFSVERIPGAIFDCRGLRLHYIDEGQGEPVVMLHGNPTWSFLYRHLIESLRGSHRVIVPDHIGCGLSEKPDDSRYAYTLESRVDDLEALLEYLGLDRELTLVAARLGRNDRHGVCGQAPGTNCPAGRDQYRGVSLAGVQSGCRACWLLSTIAAGGPLVRGAQRLLPWNGPDRMQAADDAARSVASVRVPV